jgi:hypothetical protein
VSKRKEGSLANPVRLALRDSNVREIIQIVIEIAQGRRNNLLGYGTESLGLTLFG